MIGKLKFGSLLASLHQLFWDSLRKGRSHETLVDIFGKKEKIVL